MDNIATMDHVHSNRKKVVVRNKKDPVRKKNIHMILKGDDLKRLEDLRERVDPPTQTEVFSNALQLFDEILREYDLGSEFFIMRKGDSKPTMYDIFG